VTAYKFNGGRFPIVGLGASAGGLAALEQFFAKVPPGSGMAFVVVTHQHAGHASLLAELLGRKTEMNVVRISKAATIEPNRVYTASPGFNLAILNGVLHPMEISSLGPVHLPVDYFFRSLAQDQKEQAVAVVLSGTGTDGSLGIKEIKAALGLVLVQDEKSAEYTGMPRSAVATGCADYVLRPAEMAAQIIAYAKGLAPVPAALEAEEEARPPEGLQKIFLLLRSRTGHDFSLYKVNTLRRRVERRIHVHHLETLNDYVRFLQANPTELDLLFKELLIGVTSFFRDAQGFDVLLPVLSDALKKKSDKYIVRAWVPGCATGEEAYSIAILLREAMDQVKRTYDMQIFATDIDTEAITAARLGVFSAGIANDVTHGRLSRFFVRDDETYRVKKEIREMMVFAPQNVIADPPFTKLDVLSCRNLLIYLDNKLQKRLIPFFHYALKPGGVLFLGPSESISGFANLFEPVDKKWKIFRRREASVSAYPTEFFTRARGPHSEPLLRVATPPRGRGSDAGIASATEKLLLKDLVPPSVVVHERGDVVHVHGRTGLFLEPAPGPQSMTNIFNMIRPGMELDLATAMRQAATEKGDVRRRVRLKTNGGYTSAEICVRHVTEPEALKGLFLISFERPYPVEAPAPLKGPEGRGKALDRFSELEHELRRTKETHQGTIEELETASEELKSTNEELQSSNEELQSTNEELETSKEEMQSLNEELQTVNSEVQAKVEELSRTNDDMRNLLNATDIATVFVDNDLRIKRFTEQAKSVIRLIPSDVGRDIGDLVSTLHYDRLVDDAKQVLARLTPKEQEVRGDGTSWFLMRILPYRTTENLIDGLVLTFVDISKTKVLQEDQRRLLFALSHSPTVVFTLDRDLHLMWSPVPVFGRTPREILGKTIAEAFGAEDVKELIAAKQKIVTTRKAARSTVKIRIGGVERVFDVFIEPLLGKSGELESVSCVLSELVPVGGGR
jgi:two-component system CheB/CheR fusion protein